MDDSTRLFSGSHLIDTDISIAAGKYVQVIYGITYPRRATLDRRATTRLHHRTKPISNKSYKLEIPLFQPVMDYFQGICQYDHGHKIGYRYVTGYKLLLAVIKIF
jgi:hypothetical protein